MNFALEKMKAEPFSIIGHRGSSMAEQNSLEAIEIAIKSGADLIEVDAIKDNEGNLVLSHDKIKKGKTKVIDLLNFALDKVGIIIDLKDNSVDELVEIIKELGAGKWVVVSSLNFNVLKRLKKVNSSIQVGLSYYYPIISRVGNREEVNPVRDAIASNFEVIFPFVGVLKKRDIDMAKGNKVLVSTWVVNNIAIAMGAVYLGVNGIITDYPNKLRELKEKVSLNL
jgi:glycerophosphoryl diester phosphodiesterase